ncbi:MAG TPA: efflux RND transporter periplasmic adaptor subunit [Steroidobacteraceae bacterium]|nr:efflux RND transporter periplasmic adaptor subunit [Steroidobacteraceae bacterium]
MESRSSSAARRFPRVLLALAAAAVLGACNHEIRPAAAAKPVIAERLDATSTTPSEEYSGAVHARYESALAFRVPGKIVARYVTLGETVNRGELLARLDGTDAVLERGAADAALVAARSNLQTAQADLARYSRLVQSGAISRSAYDHQRDQVAAARATYQQAQRQYELRDNQLRYTDLRADHDGVITDVDAEVGQVVAEGQTVLSLAWSDGREVYIDVPENRIGEFTDARHISVSLWGSNDTYPGAVREKSASADPATRTFLVKIAIVGPGPEVRLGMTAGVKVEDAADPKELLIPMTALYHRGATTAVWIIDPRTGRLALAPVRVERYSDDGVVIGSGLAAGEEVVLKGVNELYQGERVRATAPLDGSTS